MKRLLTTIGIVIVLLLLILLVLYLWVLSSTNPLSNPIAKMLPWPVACSTRGCITTTDWQQHMNMRAQFASATEAVPPTPAGALTTLARQHLVQFGQVRSSITAADATRYREAVLHLTDEATVRETTGLTIQQYDTFVLVPFLEQESLRQQQRAESPDDLFRQLAGERWFFVLPFHYQWVKNEAAVVARF